MPEDFDAAIKHTAMLAYHLGHLGAMDRDHEPQAAADLRRKAESELQDLAAELGWDIVPLTPSTGPLAPPCDGPDATPASEGVGGFSGDAA